MGRVTFKKFAIGAGIAALAGYLAGILTAPQSGSETREDIKSAAKTGMSEAETQLKKINTELSVLLTEAKGQTSNFGSRASKEVEELMARAKVAKEKARQVLSAIHEGDADDEDLKRAVEEANAAVKHLRSYLKK
jgi:gas vesicle protein